MNAASDDGRGGDQDSYPQGVYRFRIGLYYTDGHESNNVADFKVMPDEGPDPEANQEQS